MATKTKAVAAAKVSNVSKKVTQGASKIYTAVKFFIKPSDNGEKETSDKRWNHFLFFFSLIYSFFS